MKNPCDNFLNNKWLVISLISLVILTAFITIDKSTGNESDHIIYSVRKDLNTFDYQRINLITINGENKKILFKTPLPTSRPFPFEDDDHLISNGRTLLIFNANDGQLTVIDVLKNQGKTIDLSLMNHPSFYITKDGEYILINATDKEGVNIFRVFEVKNGEHISTFSQIIFLSFLKDDDHLLVCKIRNELDGKEYCEVGNLNILTHDYLPLLSDFDGMIAMKGTNNREEVVYHTNNQVWAIDAESGNNTFLYQGTDSYNYSAVSSNGELACAMGDDWLLYLFDLTTGEKDKIDENAWYCFFTADNKNLIYHQYDLQSIYMVDILEENKIEIANNVNYLEFEFSQNGKFFAFVERNNFDGSDLILVDTDKNEAVFLDNNVGSFRFTNDNSKIIYIKIDDHSSDHVRSAIMSINLDGCYQPNVLIKGIGVYELIWPASYFYYQQPLFNVVR
jgi:hypothetical protein